ncbi:ABC transporter ATP-binding protein [Flexivirga sp. ID2601S]|uniref:ABC transporter ATP-binding protein n=1 Tax=Flexivirga aerilata TaxID=1656889 RepID=A0A849AHH0_9MICO|nr:MULTISPECIES: ABC transporter ATP-binding protein [Flexivirga]NNG38731.1 ABC transporter ATP-binding protein [Flexivirga aerilata]
MNSTNTVLIAHGIGHAYGGQPVLHGVDCVIPEAASVALMGPSGSGKTTLLHILAGILRPDAGTVTFHPRGRRRGAVDVSQLGSEARAALRRSDFGLVFQSGQLLGELTAVENIALPLLLSGVSYAEASRRAHDLLEPLGLPGLGDRRPGELSGGQQQRVAIARAVVTRPDVLLADEPTGALDRRTGHEVMDLLHRTRRELGSSLVLVTHDPEMAARCDVVLRLTDGRITDVHAGAMA